MRNYSNIPRLSGERMTYSRSYLCEDTCTPKPLPIVPPELRRQSDLNLKPRPTPYSGEARTCKSPQPPATSAPPATSLLNTQPCRISDTIIIPSTNLSSTPSCEPARGDVLNPVAYVEKRQWWNLALPNEIAFALPLLRSGVLLQTCGHAVHRECFQRYRMQVSELEWPLHSALICFSILSYSFTRMFCNIVAFSSLLCFISTSGHSLG